MAKHRGRHLEKKSSGQIKRRTAHAASLAKQKLWERAVAELLELPEGLDIIAFNAAFAACRWSAAASLLHVMAFSRVELDAIAATSLLKTYTTGTAWRPVLALLDEMADSSIQRDAYLLTAAISGCESCCAWKHAAQIQAQSMPHLSTSLVAWNACLAASAAATMWCLGLGMLQQLPVFTLQKDVVSCSSVLHACSLGNRWRNALEIFATMSIRGPRLNVVACGAAISAASNSARGGPWALTTLKNMQVQRLKPSVVCFNAALSACASSFMWAECIALLRTMQHDKVQPTMVSFGAAMSAVEKVERWKDALELLTEAFQSGLQPSLVASSSAIAACKHEPAAWRRAIQHTRCKTSEIWPPNLILANTLSSACESAGQWQQCTAILTSFPTWRLETAEQSYGSIVSAMAAEKDENEQRNMKTAKWKVSIQLLNQLQATDLEIDVVFLGFALNLCEATVSDGCRAVARSLRSPVATDANGSGRSLLALLRMVEDCGERSLRSA